ncbi:MAG: zinc-binding dehydrogenase [Acidimicrobiia bacterium]
MTDFNPDAWRLLALKEPQGDFELISTDVPEVSPRGLLLRQDLTGVCGSDAFLYSGAWTNYPFPIVLGHENVGTVWRLGADLKHDFLGRSLAVGDRVVVGDRRSCGRCYACLIDLEPFNCANMAEYRAQMRVADTQIHSGVIGGGFSNIIRVEHERALVFRTDLPERVAVLFEPLAVLGSTMDVELAAPGLTVVVVGTGMVGLSAIAAAKWRGAARIIAVGAPEGRLELAQDFGAAAAIDFRSTPEPQDLIKAVLAETPRGAGADVVFDCTGISSQLTTSMRFARQGGQVANLGIPPAGQATEFRPYDDMYSRNVSLRAIRGSTPRDWVRSLALLENFDAPWEKVVTHVLPLEEASRAIHALADRTYELDGREVMKIVLAANG